jgi:hypothetical protein
VTFWRASTRARQPEPLEPANLTEKVWREGFVARRGGRDRELAATLAMAAMAGQTAA